MDGVYATDPQTAGYELRTIPVPSGKDDGQVQHIKTSSVLDHGDKGLTEVISVPSEETKRSGWRLTTIVAALSVCSVILPPLT